MKCGEPLGLDRYLAQYALKILDQREQEYCLNFTRLPVVTLCHLFVGRGKKTAWDAWILKLLHFFVSSCQRNS